MPVREATAPAEREAPAEQPTTVKVEAGITQPETMVAGTVHKPLTAVEPVQAHEVHDVVESPASDQNELSPDAINAIARRVIEQMSDSVVREIAWEVVPELSELLIKQKLKEQK